MCGIFTSLLGIHHSIIKMPRHLSVSWLMSYLKDWSWLSFYFENQIRACLPSPNSSTVSAVPLSASTRKMFPLQPLCEFGNFVSDLQRRGAKPQLSLQCIALTNSRFPKLLLYAFSSPLNRSILVLLHTEQLHQLP